jgi:outer membrane protein assembly factor BamB
MEHTSEFQRKFPRRPFPRLSGRLHIFPALIPLMELVPWLLGLVGAAATLTPLAFWRQYRKQLFALAAVCFIIALGVWGWKKAHIPTEEEGSRLLPAADWPKLTVQGAAPAHVDAKTYDAFGPIWSAPLKHEPLAGPTVAGDLLLIGTFDDTVDAVSRIDGKPVWSLKKHEPVFTNPVATKDVAFLGEGLHTAISAGITAVSLPEGKVIWERQFLSHVESAPLVDVSQNRLWAGAGEESLWCLDTRDGSAIWRAKIGHIDATPFIRDGVMYVISWPDSKVHVTNLFAVDPDNGDVKWKVPLEGDIMGSPQAGPDGTILITTAIGQVGPIQAYDRGWAHAVSKDGKLLWTLKLPTISLPEAAVLADKGIEIHTLKTGELLALHVKDGSVAWSRQLGKAFDTPATLRTDTNPPLLASITSEGLVSIINAEDGTDIRNFNVKQGGYAAPAFDGDIMYITTPRDIIAYGGIHLLTRGTK